MALSVLISACPAERAHASPFRYVALGDSFSSGTGTRAYVDSTCRRSALAFPLLVASAVHGAGLVLAACSGATTRDVLASQIAALTPGTRLVTISVGGNDAGFAAVLTECAKPAWLSDCAGRVGAAQAFVRSALPGRLDAVFRQIAARSPAARVVVVGYPRLLGPRDCDAATWFSADDRRRLNATADLLAAVTAQRARLYGFAFADARAVFAGHAVCDRAPWVNGLTLPVAESYHPSAAGQRALAQVVLQALR